MFRITTVLDFGLAVFNFKFWFWCGPVQYRIIAYQFGAMCLMAAEIAESLT